MRKKLLIGAVITLFGFPALGWVILSFGNENPLDVMLRGSQHLVIQLISGVFIGLLLGWGAKKLISLNFLKPTLEKYAGIIGQFNLTTQDVLFISFCAGFGEELLFRGSIQVFLGIWVTAVIFVAIHGYLNPKNLKLSVYGIYMTLAIALLGYATEYIGIYSACVAHTVIDIVLFRYLISENKKIQNRTPYEV